MSRPCTVVPYLPAARLAVLLALRGLRPGAALRRRGAVVQVELLAPELLLDVPVLILEALAPLLAALLARARALVVVEVARQVRRRAERIERPRHIVL